MDKNLYTGTVEKATSGFYYVRNGIHLVACKVRGRLKQQRYSVCVGDRVSYRISGEKEGQIEAVLPRLSFLKRPEVANVDQAVLTFAANHPQVDFNLLDRFLVLTELSEIPAVICINKIDLIDPAELEEKLKVYQIMGYPVLTVSARMGWGIDALRRQLFGKVSVFAGPSGVGKSSLLNGVEAGLSLVTGELSPKIGRGKHTTRCAELLPLSGGGYVVDTPGFSLTEFVEMTPEALRFYFRDFKDLLADCHFASCIHHKEPQCAVKNAVMSGRIASWRYDSYLGLLAEIQALHQRRY